MSITEKKQFLSQIVEDADDKLTGLLLGLANEYNSNTSGEKYSIEEISDFHKTGDEYLQNPEKAFAVEEARQKIRNKLRDEI
jgi:hypothetical protein